MENSSIPKDSYLYLQKLDSNLFQCNSDQLWRPVGARGVFGGQIIGLALVAATQTVPSNYKVHSLHSYFIGSGDNAKPIFFNVMQIRHSRSFITKQVTAQQVGQVIFVMICSFMLIDSNERSLQHQYTMPNAPDPDLLLNREQLYQNFIDQTPKKYQDAIKQRIVEPIPIDIRPCEVLNLMDFIRPLKKSPYQMVWMKSKTKLPLDQAFHMCVAAYCTDHHLLMTTIRPLAIAHGTNPKLKLLVSLDHSMWFHQDFKADEWLLFEMESPRVSESRGIALGRLWTRDGKLVVTCAQEGLLRTSPNTIERPMSVDGSTDKNQVLHDTSKINKL